LLYSAYQDHVCWKPGEIMEGDPSVYGEGIHAFKDLLGMGHYGNLYLEEGTIVSGTVELWGEVYEHERGYRASKAAIASIDDSPFYDAAALRKLYGLTPLTRPAPAGARGKGKKKGSPRASGA
jgi:hypothetical protein